MKIAEAIINFILGLIKRAITLAIIGAAVLFTVWIFLVVMPEEAMNALEIFKNFFNP